MFQKRGPRDFEFRKFEFVSDWSGTDASPDIRILSTTTPIILAASA
jgi:hypothetical protein